MIRTLLLSLIFFFPVVSHAAIYISEVAWMGSAESSSHEWLELHNTGSAVAVDGWTLTDENNLSIELAGTVPANSYVVIERSSDESAPGQAFLIYTGALVNTGATLSLRRPDGSLLDRVSGGDGWENIGGDNETKATAQYTSAGWITAVATPGLPPTNPSQTETESDSQINQSQTSSNNQSSSDSSRSTRPASSGGDEAEPLELPPVGLQLAIDAPDTGYINQPIEFTAEASGVGDTIIASLSYQWNFGDGQAVANKSPVHQFRYPGTYVVNVFASYKRQESLARHEITILPVKLSLTENSAGDIQINNDSPYEVDISGYKLNSRDDFTFPPHTIILPNQTITINKNQIKHRDNLMLAMYDNDGSLLTNVLPDKLLAYADTDTEDFDSSDHSVVAATPERATPAPAPINHFAFTTADNSQSDKVDQEPEPRVLAATSSPAAAATVSSGTDFDNHWSYLALLLVILIASAGILIKPNSN